MRQALLAMRQALVPRRSLLADLTLWAALSAAGVLWFRDSSAPSLVLGLLLPVLVLGVAVPLARCRPGTAVLLANIPCALGLASTSSPANVYVLALAVLSCQLGARTGAARAPLLVLAACLAIDLGLCAALGVGAVWWFYAVTVLPSALLLPWLVGHYWRARRQLVRGGWQLARSLEERQYIAAEQVRLKERTHIAADMHDSLGHVLSLIALRAGALELSPTLTARDRDDVADLRATIVDAVDQLRETITVLRDAPVSEENRSSPESIEDLLNRTLASGVSVEWKREGKHEGKAAALPPLVERAAYRVVQEALTNATKHAPGSAVQVHITHGGDRTTRIRIVNSPPPGGPLPGLVPGHHGLTGLRERVTVLGGTLRATPYEGGFEVSAILPHDMPQPGPTPAPARSEVTRAEPGAARAEPGQDPRTTSSAVAPESARQLSHVRRRARLRFAAAFAAPAGAALVFLPAAAMLAYQLSTCVLSPSDYERLRIGQQRHEFAHALPQRPYPYPSDHAREAPRPPGTTCTFYRSNSNPLDQADVYRLCYSGSHLIAKDTLRGRL
ncbi:sensor histidine kinase [Streptomyces sp. NPDC055239]